MSASKEWSVNGEGYTGEVEAETLIQAQRRASQQYAAPFTVEREKKFHQTEYGTEWCVPELWKNDNVEEFDWTEGTHTVMVRDEQSLTKFSLRAWHVPRTPVVEIELAEPVPEDWLTDDIRATLVNAVSLTTMPVVNWAKS